MLCVCVCVTHCLIYSYSFLESCAAAQRATFQLKYEYKAELTVGVLLHSLFLFCVVVAFSCVDIDVLRAVESLSGTVVNLIVVIHFIHARF